MPAIDIDREAAHEAAQRELAKPIYPRASLSDRIAEWFNDLMYRMVNAGAELPGGWFTIVLLGILALAAMTVAVRIARRTMGRPGDRRFYGGGTLSAAEYRARAEQAAIRADWATAIRQRLRAIGRQLEEDGALSPVPGRTAGELANETGRVLPGVSAEISSAAAIFDDVTYGERPGAEPDYRMIAELDDRVRHQVRNRATGNEVSAR
ncbi:MAG: DUF4129 domain-containing protein [Actinomycetia bacterium]|nr:DUF4129 domain-containing protein [Actinomycetes bacterium]